MDFWDIVGIVMIVGSAIATLFSIWGVDRNGMVLDARTNVRLHEVVIALWVICLIYVILLTGWMQL